MKPIPFHILPARITILGVPVDNVTQAQALEQIKAWLSLPGQYHIATPNPEMLVEARHNQDFRRILQSTALNIPDGTGLLWAAKRQGTPLPERVTGTDLMMALCNQQDVGLVFLLGGWEGVAKRARDILCTQNPSLRIAGTFAGSPNVDDEQSIIDHITASGAQILFVAYGSPAQELWIARNLAKMPLVRVAMGVGGAFDFIAGTRKRAPKILQKVGVEWLWRLCWQPSRIRRIWNAVVVFPILVLSRRMLDRQKLRGIDN